MFITDIFSAMRAGKELANAETWKKAQVRTSLLVALLSAGVGLAKAFGLDIPLTAEEINAIAVVVGLIGGLFMGVATVVSTTRVGLPARDSDDLPGTPDGIRDGTVEGRPYEWIRELDDRDSFQMPDMKDRG